MLMSKAITVAMIVHLKKDICAIRVICVREKNLWRNPSERKAQAHFRNFPNP